MTAPPPWIDAPGEQLISTTRTMVAWDRDAKKFVPRDVRLVAGYSAFVATLHHQSFDGFSLIADHT